MLYNGKEHTVFEEVCRYAADVQWKTDEEMR